MSFFLNTTVCGFTLYQILAYFLVYSCLGWCLEVVYAAATTGQIVNRGFLNGPVCPIYGFGMVIVLFVLTPFEHSTLALYIGGVILPSALELVGGWALYKLYHTRWWDYSDKPFNIGGYICLEFSLLWGVGTLVMMKAIHPTIAGLVELVPPFIGFLLMCFLYAVYAADVVVTAVAASDLARELDALENVADSIHAVSDAMTEILGTTAMEADQKLDENRLQFKLAAAEARDAAAQLSPKEAAEAMRRKADEARDAARRASEISRLNAAEAAKAVKLAAKGTAERTAGGRIVCQNSAACLGRIGRRRRYIRVKGLHDGLAERLLLVGDLNHEYLQIQSEVRACLRECSTPLTGTGLGGKALEALFLGVVRLCDRGIQLVAA